MALMTESFLCPSRVIMGLWTDRHTSSPANTVMSDQNGILLINDLLKKDARF